MRHLISYFKPEPETFLLNEQFARHFPRDSGCLSENLSVNFFPFIGEKGREEIFMTYVYAFHLLFNFHKEYLFVDKILSFF